MDLHNLHRKRLDLLLWYLTSYYADSRIARFRLNILVSLRLSFKFQVAFLQFVLLYVSYAHLFRTIYIIITISTVHFPYNDKTVVKCVVFETNIFLRNLVMYATQQTDAH